MRLKYLKTYNFKNIVSFEEEFSNGINCFTGPNSIGKTNLLDSIHYLSFTKSYFNTLDIKNIRHGENFYAIHGTFSASSNDVKVSCIQREGQKKQFLINEKPYKRFSEHIGKFPLIMISPYDQDLINDGSEIRRKFADIVISQFDTKYLESLVIYNKLLQQRNNLLKQFAEKNTFDENYLSMWDEQMQPHCNYIFQERNSFFTELIPVFQQYYYAISNLNETVDLQYISQFHEGISLTELLKKNREKDRILKHTTAGIHKDDIALFINGYHVKNYGSQGQQKTYVTALKLAQYDYIKKHKNLSPILLLDDIFDKLDESRVGNIIKIVGEEQFGQVFITDTNAERINKLLSRVHEPGKLFKMEEYNNI